MLISILTPSRRPHQLVGFFDSIEAMTSELSDIEVVVKIDDDHPEALETLSQEIKKRPFRIKVINSPRYLGVLSIWLGMQDAFVASDPDAYFVWLVTDETRILTKGWDDVLRKYVGFFEDDIFRLKLSGSRYNNYSHPFQCSTIPDSFAVFTRKWLELTEGLGDCWGSDTVQAQISFHLGLGDEGYGNVFGLGSEFRDIPIHDIQFGGWHFGDDRDSQTSQALNLTLMREWYRLVLPKQQELYNYLAKKLSLYIWAYENQVSKFRYVKDEDEQVVRIVDPETGDEIHALSYRMPTLFLFAQLVRTNFRIRDHIFARHLGQRRAAVQMIKKWNDSKPQVDRARPLWAVIVTRFILILTYPIIATGYVVRSIAVFSGQTVRRALQWGQSFIKAFTRVLPRELKTWVVRAVRALRLWGLIKLIVSPVYQAVAILRGGFNRVRAGLRRVRARAYGLVRDVALSVLRWLTFVRWTWLGYQEKSLVPTCMMPFSYLEPEAGRLKAYLHFHKMANLVAVTYIHPDSLALQAAYVDYQKQVEKLRDAVFTINRKPTSKVDSIADAPPLKRA